MSDNSKTIENLELHEETMVQAEDYDSSNGDTMTMAMRVPGGLIYKFFHKESEKLIYVISSSQFVPFTGFSDSIPSKGILGS